MVGPIGLTGPTGAAGAAGAAGATGATGATGVAELAAYGNFVSTTFRTITAGSQVILDAALNITENINFTAGGTSVTIVTPGVYQILYNIRTSSGADAVMSLLVNGAPLPNSAVSVLSDVGESTGYAMVALNTNDTVSIGTAGVEVALAVGANAFLNLMRIGE